MIQKTYEVHSSANSPDGKRAVVATVQADIYDSLTEATEALGEDTILALVNTQNITNMKNKARAEATGKPSKEDLRIEAFEMITDEERAATKGDTAALKNLLERNMKIVEKKKLAERQSRVAAVATAAVADDQDDDEDDEDLED